MKSEDSNTCDHIDHLWIGTLSVEQEDNMEAKRKTFQMDRTISLRAELLRSDFDSSKMD